MTKRGIQHNGGGRYLWRHETGDEWLAVLSGFISDNSLNHLISKPLHHIKYELQTNIILFEILLCGSICNFILLFVLQF